MTQKIVLPFTSRARLSAFTHCHGKMKVCETWFWVAKSIHSSSIICLHFAGPNSELVGPEYRRRKRPGEAAVVVADLRELLSGRMSPTSQSCLTECCERMWNVRRRRTRWSCSCVVEGNSGVLLVGELVGGSRKDVARTSEVIACHGLLWVNPALGRPYGCVRCDSFIRIVDHYDLGQAFVAGNVRIALLFSRRNP